MRVLETLNVQDWQLFQQHDGKTDINIVMRLNENGWLNKPQIEAERQFEKVFYGVRCRCINENTGETVTAWTQAERKGIIFECAIKDVPAGGPYQLQTELIFRSEQIDQNCKTNNAANHVGVGDIFLIAGQSNADGSAKGMHFDEIDMNVRSYKNGEWSVASQPLGNGYTHSPFLVFGKLLSKKLGYPIALLSRAVGGSPIKTWINGGEHMENLKKEKIGKIKGILWYQGCEEAARNQYDTYEELFCDFLRTARGLFDDDNLPVITFQLNRLLSSEICSETVNVGWENIREVQRQIAQRHDNVYLVPTVDMKTMSDHIHNSVASNKALGERCAMYALDRIYNRTVFRAPELRKAQRTGENVLVLEFDNVTNDLCAFSVTPDKLPIMLEDRNGKNEIEKYEICKNKITVYTSRSIDDGTSVKIHFGANPEYIITDFETQLPVVCIKNAEITL